MKSKETYQKTVSYADILAKAAEIFYDKDKVIEWYLAPNPFFKGRSPYEHAKKGYSLQVLKYLEKYQT